jgi:hypothetical protein
MLKLLREENVADGRKLRLFAVACCRRVDECLIAETRSLLEIAERVAEGTADERERRVRRDEALRAGWHPDPITRSARGPAKAAVAWALARRPEEAALYAAHYALNSAVALAANWKEEPVGNTPQERLANWEARKARVRQVQADLLRDLFGNPFRPCAVDPFWLMWNGGTVPKLAQAIYEDRRFSDLPILADALEEAGCTDNDILNHCRQPGEHVLGCLTVDLLLGKQ